MTAELATPARRLAEVQAAYALADRERIARMAERDELVRELVAAGELTGRRIAELTGLTPPRISQLKRAGA